MSAATNGTTVSNISDIVVETELKGPDGTTNHGTVTTTIHRAAPLPASAEPHNPPRLLD